MTELFDFVGGGVASSSPLVGSDTEPTIFELSVPGRKSSSFRNSGVDLLDPASILESRFLRSEEVDLPEVSERDLVGHYTRLASRQYSVDMGAYPLGSCTMKYNPKFADSVAGMPGLNRVHPGSPDELVQGWLELLVMAEEYLCEITGMQAATFQPAAGAAGELTGLLVIRAYLQHTGSKANKIIIPDSSHGTNPASVTLSGFDVVTVPSDESGLVDTDALAKVLDGSVAGMMMTNPNTLGLFEVKITEIARMVHEVGGLMYYDGANLNAVLGISRPGDMGFDVVHSNLHKTFATPHGGGGPGSGPVAVSGALADFLPGPKPCRLSDKENEFGWYMPPRSIGRVHSHFGNAVVVARALAYMVYNGSDGLKMASDLAVLNANWLKASIADYYEFPFDGVCMHEFVASALQIKKETGIRGLDIAKSLFERGFHAPTVYFPLIVEEALMIEPTETESPQTVRALADALIDIAKRAHDPETKDALHDAPTTTPVRRLDEARAARNPKLIF